MRISRATLVLLLLSTVPAAARTWTDRSGTFHQDGEYVSLIDGVVRLREPNGRMCRIAWKNLSAKDQEFINEQIAREPSKQARDAVASFNAATSERLSPSQPRSNNRDLPVALGAFSQVPQPAGKRIFSGCRSTFQVNGATGTGAYWLRDAGGKPTHYLTSLTFNGHDGSGKYLVYLSVGTEGGVYDWYFYDQEVCGCGGSPVYMIGAIGPPIFYELDYREIPN